MSVWSTNNVSKCVHLICEAPRDLQRRKQTFLKLFQNLAAFGTIFAKLAKRRADRHIFNTGCNFENSKNWRTFMMSRMSKICKNVEHPSNVFTPHSSTLKIPIFAHFWVNLSFDPLCRYTHVPPKMTKVWKLCTYITLTPKKIWGLWRIIPLHNRNFSFCYTGVTNLLHRCNMGVSI